VDPEETCEAVTAAAGDDDDEGSEAAAAACAAAGGCLLRSHKWAIVEQKQTGDMNSPTETNQFSNY
jgi:hypothetical protein